MTIDTPPRPRPAPGGRPGPGPVRLVRVAVVMISLAVLVAAVVVGVVVATRASGPCSFVSECRASTTTGTGPSAGTAGTFTLSPDQAQNAAIIAAVAYDRHLPDHAVTIALATALQESGLLDLPYGDLDSVGLFQQRPSQGWGTRDQLLDPVYAAGAFFTRLVTVPGWTSLPVTEAAQAVQHSAAPTAYANWESEARTLAIGLTGETAAGFSCHLDGFTGARPAPSALTAAATHELGAALIGAPVTTTVGWRVATWAVAHSWQYHLSDVSFEGRTWSAASGRWTTGSETGPATGPARGTVTVVYGR